MTDEERRRRREAHRRTWLELTFDEIPTDVDAAVFELWLSGATSTRVAMEILDAGLDELRRRVIRSSKPYRNGHIRFHAPRTSSAATLERSFDGIRTFVGPPAPVVKGRSFA